MLAGQYICPKQDLIQWLILLLMKIAAQDAAFA